MLSYSVCARPHLAVNGDSRTQEQFLRQEGVPLREHSAVAMVAMATRVWLTAPSIRPCIHLSICLSVCQYVYLRRSSGDNSGSQDNRASGQPVIQPKTVTYRSSPRAPIRICLRCPVRNHRTVLTRSVHSMTTPADAPIISSEYSNSSAFRSS
jgi:hypothetical protein